MRNRIARTPDLWALFSCLEGFLFLFYPKNLVLIGFITLFLVFLINSRSIIVKIIEIVLSLFDPTVGKKRTSLY